MPLARELAEQGFHRQWIDASGRADRDLADVRAITSLEVIELERQALAEIIETNEKIADQLADPFRQLSLHGVVAGADDRGRHRRDETRHRRGCIGSAPCRPARRRCRERSGRTRPSRVLEVRRIRSQLH